MEVDAGKIAEAALSEYGSGGGHSFMAGGLIKTEDIHLLGPEPDDRIQELFMNAISRG